MALPKRFTVPGHPKVGGRQKGTKNKRDEIRRELMTAVMPELPEGIRNITPLETLLLCMHWAIAKQDRNGMLAAASAAAPYMHARLASAEVRVRNEHADMSDEELLREMAELERRIANAGLPLIPLKPKLDS